MSGVEVRPLYDEAELSFIVEIEREVFGELAWTQDMLIKEYESPGSQIMVLRYGDRVIGYLIFRKFIDEVEVLRFAVSSNYQGRGYGRLLFKKFLEEMKKSGIKNIYLEVSPTNFRAIRIYESEGFKKIGRRKNYYSNGEDALVLNLSIGG